MRAGTTRANAHDAARPIGRFLQSVGSLGRRIDARPQGGRARGPHATLGQMARRVRRMVTAAIAAGAMACAGAAPPPAPAPTGHGYALLHEILGQERQVSMLLVIKGERDALERVIDEIAETCGDAYERLEELGEADPRLELRDTGLPAEERRARELVAATRRDALLAASGRELELQLLLAQNEALSYAAHLADAISRSEPDPARLEFVRALWKDLTRLQGEVLALLRNPPG